MSAPVTINSHRGAFSVSPHITKEAITMPSNLNLDYYYGNEAEQYSFYRIPKTLLTFPSRPRSFTASCWTGWGCR